MAANLRSWWQQLRKYLVVIIIISIIVVIALIIAGYIFNWDWTGFNGGFSQITTTQTINKAITATEKPPGKTLWDWLQLLGVVAIPVVVVFGAAWFTRVQQQRDKRLEKAQRDRDRQLADQRAESERKAAVEQAKLERELTLDNQRETELQTYIDKMSELLLDKSLRDSQPEDEVRKIAQVRTLTVLLRLDAARNKTLLDFLFGSNLLHRTADKDIIELQNASLRRVLLDGADLHKATLTRTDLFNAQLHEANLSYANLTSADLNGTHLLGADLRGANLTGAKVTTEQLDKAKSLEGTTMPDGSKHP